MELKRIVDKGKPAVGTQIAFHNFTTAKLKFNASMLLTFKYKLQTWRYYAFFAFSSGSETCKYNCISHELLNFALIESF